MSRLRSRIKRLQNSSQKNRKRGIHFILVEPGDTESKAVRRYREQNPKAGNNHIYYIMDFSGLELEKGRV